MYTRTLDKEVIEMRRDGRELMVRMNHFEFVMELK